MYTDKNFKTKKAFKEALAEGKKMRVYVPGGMFSAPLNGPVTVEGPHYPEPHRWYAACVLKDGIIIKIS
jgi:hypothetical protein